MMEEKTKKAAEGLKYCQGCGLEDFECAEGKCPYDEYGTGCLAALHRDLLDVLADALLPPPNGADYANMLEECVNRGTRIAELEKELDSLKKRLEEMEDAE